MASASPFVAASPAWRYAAYGVFILVRLALHARDHNFPAHDGAYYVEKAAWMAAAPFERAFSGEAFSHTAIRPPGPMWLLLPFMIMSNTFVSFVIGMSFWIAAFVEVAVRSACRPVGALRNWAAVGLLCATGAFLCPRSFYLVDALFAVQAVAAVGCALAWIRDRRRLHALLCGFILALAVLTKPAGLYAIAVTGLCLAVAHLLIWWRSEKTSFIQGPLSAARTLLLWTGIPVAASLAALLLTPYKATLAFPKIMKVPGFGNQGLGQPFSSDSFFRSGQYTLANLGLLPALAALGIGSWLTWKLLSARRPAGQLAEALFPLGAAMLFVLCIAGTPVIQPRYLTPAALMLALWSVATASSLATSSARLAAAAFGTVAVLWQVLALNQKLPHVPALPACYNTVDRQESEKALFHAFSAALTTDANSAPLLFSTDLKDHSTPFHTSLVFAHSGIEKTSGMLRTPKKFRMATATFPHAFILDAFSTDFLSADYLLASRPGAVHAMPAGSGSADWQWINDWLWEKDVAKALGWNEIARTADGVLYVSSPEAPARADSELPLAHRRASWLLAADLRSPQGPELKKRLAPFSILQGLAPTGRIFHHHDTADGAWEFLLHSEYPKNNFPSQIKLALSPDHVLTTRMQGEKGDGVLVRMSVEDASSTAPRVLVEKHATRDKPARIALADYLKPGRHNAKSTQTVTLSVAPGASGDFTFDAVWFRLKQDGQ